MINIKKILKVYLMTMALCFILSGCFSMMLKGGTFVSKTYKVQKVLVAYRAEGSVPERMQYFLVDTDNGLAIFEREEDGSGSLIETHWTDDQGDHFAAWILNGPAYEYVIPTDRAKEGKRYFYKVNSYGLPTVCDYCYSIKMIDGIERPVPLNPNIEPVARLIPK